MSKDIKLTLTDSAKEALAAIDAGNPVVRVKDDEGQVLGFVTVNKWLADRPKILLQKIIKDTGCGAAESVELVEADEIKDAAKAEKKTKTEKIEKPKTGRIAKKGTGLEGDASSEQELIAKYGEKIVPGTIRFEETGVYAGKRTVEIRCRQLDVTGWEWLDRFNEHTRRIATSDLFQVQGTVADHAELRKARRRIASKLRKLNKK